MKEMIWDEAMIRYATDRMCRKYSPRECHKCPLERWSECRVVIMIEEVKKWADSNIPEDVLEAKRVK